VFRPIRRLLRPARQAWRRTAGPLRARIALARDRRRLGTQVTFNEKVRYKMLWDACCSRRSRTRA